MTNLELVQFRISDFGFRIADLTATTTLRATPARRLGLSASFAGLCALALVCAAGCSGTYKQKSISSQSPQFRQVQDMLVDLRKAGADKLDETMSRQGAEMNDEGRRAGLRFVLDELARADSAELKQLDRFGENVFRAAIAVRRQGAERTIYMLLVERDDKLLWAGPN